MSPTVKKALPAKRILNVTVCSEPDETGDSDTGSYGSKPENAYSIDRKARGWIDRNSYQYWNPNIGNYEGSTDEELRTYVEQDYKREEERNAGEWSYLFVQASAEISLTGVVCQTIRSGGLGNVESDSGDAYLTECADEQLDDLRDELEAIGFSSDEIDAAFAGKKVRL